MMAVSFSPVIATLLFLDATFLPTLEPNGQIIPQSVNDIEKYEQIGRETLSHIKDLERSEKWKELPQKGVERLREGGRTTFRGSSQIDVSPQSIFEELWYRGSDTPEWNKDVESAKELVNITDHSKISYQTSASQLNGYVSGRDFVTLSYYSIEGPKYYIVYKSIEYEGQPEVTGYVRAENGPSAMVFNPVDDNENITMFTWYMDTDFKFSWAGSMVTSLYPTSVLNYLTALKEKMEGVKESV